MFKNMKFRVANVVQSEELQNVLFSLGYKWAIANDGPIFTDKPFIFTDGDHSYITYAVEGWYFESHRNMTTDTAAFIDAHTKAKKEENNMSNGKKQHKHAEVIVEHVLTRCPLEWKWPHEDDSKWKPCPFPSWLDGCDYRVKPGRVFPKSSLTRQDLLCIVQETAGDFMDSYLAMADKAVQRYIEDCERAK
jgi:hypothetical protein